MHLLDILIQLNTLYATIRGKPIVAITAYALREDEEHCLAAGMDAFVSKPVDFKKFFETIRGLIGTT